MIWSGIARLVVTLDTVSIFSVYSPVNNLRAHFKQLKNGGMYHGMLSCSASATGNQAEF